jgi:hypothetical protein
MSEPRGLKQEWLDELINEIRERVQPHQLAVALGAMIELRDLILKRLPAALAEETLKITYERADGEMIFGEYSWVGELEFFDDEDEPIDLIKKTWLLMNEEQYQHIPPGWEPLDDE